MKKTLLAVLLGAAAFSAYAGVDVNVNVGIPGVVVGGPVVTVGDPNFYGSIDVGPAPPPPGMFTPAPGVVFGVGVTPMYLHVPIGHSHDWRRYCGVYNACGRPVYFVNDNWYRNSYAPRYRIDHYERHDDHHDQGRHEGWHDQGRHDEHRDQDRHEDWHDQGRHDEHHDEHRERDHRD
ncbi:MAG TPA: hypothetical protein VNW52_09080 [Burkholderiaceae bacterium]|jgi:hypothetical protein|nr:hypothetical protein [Burkholderiaceae bacterium]